MRNEIYHKLKLIGFKFYKKTRYGAGVSLDYYYHPSTLGDNHYSLRIFIHKRYTVDLKGMELYREREFRLYIHDKNGQFVSSPFQSSDSSFWNKKYLNLKINELFKNEIRQLKLERICGNKPNI